MAIDDRTSVFDFPKPNQDNTLLEDVARLRAALDAIDAAIQGRQAALSFTPENAVNKGATNGYAGLDGAARVPTSQLPSVPTQLGFTPESVSNKGAANGYAGLDSGGKVPAVQLPSYVDDVLEFANFASLPAVGETGKIYILLTPYTSGGVTSSQFRWTGSTYVAITASPGSTDSIAEGSVNLYFTSARALASVPVATASVPGRVKPGTGLSVAGDGTLNATGSDQTFDDITLTVSTNGQTAFTVSGGYVPGAIDVHLNGVKLNGGGDDYTATNGTSITLTVGANTADLLVLRRWSTFQIANAVTLTGAQTLTNKTAQKLVLNDGYTEEVFAITDGTTVNLDPNNGSIQTWTLGANRTPGQANWAAGQSITLLVDDGSSATITWTSLAVVWKTDGGVAPTLNTTGFTVVVLWKVGTTIYGARVGNA
jgi:hypothetical protein